MRGGAHRVRAHHVEVLIGDGLLFRRQGRIKILQRTGDRHQCSSALLHCPRALGHALRRGSGALLHLGVHRLHGGSRLLCRVGEGLPCGFLRRSDLQLRLQVTQVRVDRGRGIDPGHRPVTMAHAHTGSGAVFHAAVWLRIGYCGDCQRDAGNKAGYNSVNPFHGPSPMVVCNPLEETAFDGYPFATVMISAPPCKRSMSRQGLLVAHCDKRPDDTLRYVEPSENSAMDTLDHILIVDDDAEIRSLLSQYLQKNGLRVTAVADGRAMWQALEAGRIDLIVLDLMLPGEDGLTLCRNLRAKSSDIPVIMLTARGEETDRIVGLEMGADDYLAKPFSARELIARIKAILRRARTLPENLRPDNARNIRFGDWLLDTVQRQLVSAAGVVIPLSGAEYRLLRIFLSR